MFFIFLGFSFLASAITANKFLLATFSPMFFVGVRMLIAGIILFYIHYSRHTFSFARIKADFWILVGAALCTTYFQSIFKAYALKYMISSKAAFIGSLDPFVTALLVYIFFNERLTVQKIIGITLAFVGSCYLCLSGSPVEAAFFAISIFSLPELAAFGAMIIGRCGWLQAQQLLRKNRYTPIELNGLMMIISGCTSLISSFFCEDLSYLNCSLLTVKVVLLFSYTVIVGNVIAYSMYASFLKRHSASLVSLAGFSVPIFVSFNGWLFLSEPITSTLLVAALIIFSGFLLFYYHELS